MKRQKVKKPKKESVERAAVNDYQHYSVSCFDFLTF